MVDTESDGPIPGDYSMISFGAVLVQTKSKHEAQVLLWKVETNI